MFASINEPNTKIIAMEIAIKINQIFQMRQFHWKFSELNLLNLALNLKFMA